MSNTNLISILLKNNLTIQDIIDYTELSRDSAYELMKTIRDKYCKGMLLARGTIPTQFFIKERNVNLEEISRKAKIEKELERGNKE